MGPSPVPGTPPAPHSASLSTTATIVLVIGALYLGREIFIPLALAVLLGFVLTPPIQWIRRRGLPRIAAVVLVLLVAFGSLGAVATVVGAQLVNLAQNLPTHQRNIQAKLSALRSSAPGSGIIEKVTGTIKELGRELSRPEQKTAGPGQRLPEPPPGPVPVVIQPAPMQPFELLQSVVGPLIGPLGTAALVILFLFFILIEREELRDRFIKLAGGGDLQRSTEAISEAGTRVSRYLLMQLVVNVTYGIPIGIGLYLIGVPNAMLWGVLAAVLRFIPYLGPWLAALFPLTIAFGVDPGWSMLLWTVALFLAMELFSNNVLEPWLYGTWTGLSSFAIILAAIFWTLLWGPAGLFLATPLTVCLVVLGRYVPQLEFLGVLLGSEPVLTPAEQFYQRLLSDNVEEAVELAEAHVEEKSSLAFYDEVAIPALRLAENDRQRSMEIEFRRSLADGVRAVAREVEDHVRETAAAGKSAEQLPPAPNGSDPPRVLCIGGRTELDQAAAELLTRRLAELGIPARTLPPVSVSAAAIGQIELDGVAAVCISYFHPQPHVSARFIARRLDRRAPDIAKIICCWNLPADKKPAELEAEIGANAGVVTTLEGAERKVVAALKSEPVVTAGPTQMPDHAADIVARMRKAGLVSGNGPHFEQLADLVTERFGDNLVLVVVADEACRARAAGTAAASEDAAGAQVPLGTLICSEVIKADRSLVVNDVAEDERFSANPELLEKGVRSFVATPLRTSIGGAVGVLCVLESAAQEFDEELVRALEEIAARLVGSLERNQPVSALELT